MRSVWLAHARLFALGTLALVVSATLVAGFAEARPVGAHSPSRQRSGILSRLMSWQVVSSPNVGDVTTNNYLYGLAAVSSSDLWAVGSSSYQGQDATLIERWNGTAWTVVASPNPGSASDDLYAAAADSATDVWVVGNQVVANVGITETLVEHYTGSSWQYVLDAPRSGSWASLDGVSARTASDIWAVGDTGPAYSGGSSYTFIEHFDGTQWTQVASPSPSPVNVSALNAVASDSASNVWAVGYYEPSGSTTEPLVEHYDGSTWSVASLPASLTSLDGHFNSVVALATNNVWAVGDYYDMPTNRNHTLVAHWNGSTWSPVPSPDGSTFDRFYGIAAMSATSIWATGDQYIGGSGPAGPLTEYWDGCQWRVVSASSANSFDNTLHAVAAGPMLSTPVAVGNYQYGATGAFEKTLTETLTGQPLHTQPRMALCRATS